MARNKLTLDLAQCEVFKHLTAWKAGVLIKAITDYWTTGEVSPWGEDADLKPMFLTFRATLEKQREEEEEKQMKEKRRKHAEYLRRKGNSPNSPGENGEKETERETERDKEKVTPKEKEKEKGKGKEKCVRAPQFVPPTLAQVKEYVETKGLKMEAEHFYDHFTSNGWKVSGRASMKDWRAAVRNWARNEPQYQPRKGNGTSVGERAYNMLHFEYEGHPEMWEEEQRRLEELQAFRK